MQLQVKPPLYLSCNRGECNQCNHKDGSSWSCISKQHSEVWRRGKRRHNMAMLVLICFMYVMPFSLVCAYHKKYKSCVVLLCCSVCCSRCVAFPNISSSDLFVSTLCLPAWCIHWTNMRYFRRDKKKLGNVWKYDWKLHFLQLSAIFPSFWPPLETYHVRPSDIYHNPPI